MAKMKKPKKPKKPFKESKPKQDEFSNEGLSKAERKLNKQMIKEALKRKKEFKKRLDRCIGISAVLLCIISSVLDVLIANKNKSE